MFLVNKGAPTTNSGSVIKGYKVCNYLKCRVHLQLLYCTITQSLLQIAAYNGHYDVAVFLLERGADPYYKNGEVCK